VAENAFTYTDTGATVTNAADSGTVTVVFPQTEGADPQLLSGPAVSYAPGTFVPSADFIFDIAVNGVAEGWVITGNGGTALTATPAPETSLTPGFFAAFTLSVANVLDETKTLDVPAWVMPVSGALARPGPDDEETAYTVVW
jgi:hypothetical protein